MARKIDKADFDFTPVGYGRYKVTYTSPATGKCWCAEITDMSYIDNVKHEDFPKRKDLQALKRRCKQG